jgi:hypothetical protein
VSTEVVDRRWAPIEVLEREARAHQGSDEITKWCPTCLERVVPMRNGSCGWCDAPLAGDEAPPPDQRPSVLVQDPAHPSPAPAREQKPRVPRRVSRDGQRRDRRHRHGKPFTDEQIIGRIQLWAQIVGRPPAKADWNPSRLRLYAKRARDIIDKHLRAIALYELGDFPSETTVRARFGSLNAALELAGFEPRPTGRQPVSDIPQRKPHVGAIALRGYVRDVERAREQDDPWALKQALYDLAMSAIAEGDRTRPPQDILPGLERAGTAP